MTLHQHDPSKNAYIDANRGQRSEILILKLPSDKGEEACRYLSRDISSFADRQNEPGVLMHYTWYEMTRIRLQNALSACRSSEILL